MCANLSTARVIVRQRSNLQILQADSKQRNKLQLIEAAKFISENVHQIRLWARSKSSPTPENSQIMSK